MPDEPLPPPKSPPPAGPYREPWKTAETATHIDQFERAVDLQEHLLKLCAEVDAGKHDARRLAKVRDAHAAAGSSPAALGQDLRNHAALADAVRARLAHDDAGFDLACIDEALVLASRLARPSLAPEPAEADGDVAPTVGTLSLRNRLLRLLVDRVALVRHCARHVFAAHAEVLQEVTSAYERERRARGRKARANDAPKPDAPADDALKG